MNAKTKGYIITVCIVLATVAVVSRIEVAEDFFFNY